jgi:hypothetical protein
MKSDPELRADIQSRCGRVKMALDDCPKSGLRSFYQTLGDIRSGSDIVACGELQSLDSRLDALIKRLQVTEDANGVKILGRPRWGKFMQTERMPSKINRFRNSNCDERL